MAERGWTQRHVNLPAQIAIIRRAVGHAASQFALGGLILVSLPFALVCAVHHLSTKK